MSIEKKQRIMTLVRAILSFLEANRSHSEGADLVMRKVEALDLSLAAIADREPRLERHAEVLSHAIEDISSADLRDIAEGLKLAQHDLVWREDDGRYYPPDADLGDGYRNCNLHTVLIGPDACGFEAAGFCLGLFMLGPRTLYRDHAHAAPELYVNLSPRSGWRLSDGWWRDFEAGSLIWNAPGEVHATRAYERPFLSVFVWLEDIEAQCQVVPFPDWPDIEGKLRQDS